MRIGVWGIGERTERYMQFGYFENVEIVFFVDSNKYGTEYCGKDVISPMDLGKRMEEIDYLVLSSIHYSEMFMQCKKLGVDYGKIICTDCITEPFVCGNNDVVKSHFPRLFEDSRMRRVHLMFENETDDFDKDKRLGCNIFQRPEYVRDYSRYRTFEFVAREIVDYDVQGVIAELGVFRGTFSALINAYFPDRRIYLFDTFEGFCENEAKKEEMLGRSNKEFEFSHKSTNEEIVRNKLENPDVAVFCKGLFPGTVTDEIRNERFAFVSIDVDFEDSILEGLRFFYPRLNDNGVIFLHDYNSQYLGGVKKAIKRYEQESGEVLRKVPIADRAGTLVIVK